MLALALGAYLGDGALEAAIVALELLVALVMGQRDSAILALHRLAAGAAKHHRSIGDLAAHHCDIASLIARGLFLLVGGIVFFIHDDEREVFRFDRSKNCGAGPDNDAGLAAADAVPLLGTLVGREA